MNVPDSQRALIRPQLDVDSVLHRWTVFEPVLEARP